MTTDPSHPSGSALRERMIEDIQDAQQLYPSRSMLKTGRTPRYPTSFSLSVRPLLSKLYSSGWPVTLCSAERHGAAMPHGRQLRRMVS